MSDSPKIHLNILDKERLEIIPKMKSFSSFGFYLAGGTGLALQLGHRDSIDFDFFKEGDFDVDFLKNKVEEIFKDYEINITQKEINTLSLFIDQKVKISFFGYKNKLLYETIKTDYFEIASILDIACMKLSAILSRSLEKDYIDLFFILKSFSLEEILEEFKKKYPNLDLSLVLKSLVYFDDLIREPILFKENNNITLAEVQKDIENKVKDFLTKNK